MSDIYGLIGILLILGGWAYETLIALKAGKTSIPLAFSILYGAGSLLLFVHSLLLNDLVFMVLNVFATLIPLVNIVLAVKNKENKKGKRK